MSERNVAPKLRFSELSPPRQALIRQCQRMDFGRILSLEVRNGEPVLGPATAVLLDVKLDSAETSRPEHNPVDFVVCGAIVRLLATLDAIGNGSVEHVEVRAGIPVRMIFKA